MTHSKPGRTITEALLGGPVKPGEWTAHKEHQRTVQATSIIPAMELYQYSVTAPDGLKFRVEVKTTKDTPVSVKEREAKAIMAAQIRYDTEDTLGRIVKGAGR